MWLLIAKDREWNHNRRSPILPSIGHNHYHPLDHKNVLGSLCSDHLGILHYHECTLSHLYDKKVRESTHNVYSDQIAFATHSANCLLGIPNLPSAFQKDPLMVGREVCELGSPVSTCT